MKLITETIEDFQPIVNTKDGEKQYFIEGIFLQANIKNRNGRVYPLSTMQREVEKYKRELVDTQGALGELDHPEGPTINMDRVSHVITELRQEGANFIGKARIIDSNTGKLVKTFIDEGIRIGVSSRGLGTLQHKNGVNEVQSDFKLVTAADIVATPSAPNAFVNGILEGVEFNISDANLYDKIDQIVKSKNKNLTEAETFDLYKTFLESLY